MACKKEVTTPLFILLLFCFSISQLAEASGREQFQIEVKRQEANEATCPSGSKAALNLNLLCEIDDGAKWSWNSTALLDEGETLKIFESVDSKVTEAPSPPQTPAPTIPPTAPQTAPPTQAPTKPPTQPPTQPPTKPPTRPPPPPPTSTVKATTTTRKPRPTVSLTTTTQKANNTHHPTSCNLVWVDASVHNASRIPHKLLGGHEANGEKLYVCRSADPNDVNSFPGKFSSRQNVCVVSWNPDRVYTSHFQVLTNPHGVPMRWVADRRGHVPPKTWLGGEVKVNSHPSLYYVGRVKVGQALQVGKIKVRGEYVIAYVSNPRYTDYRKAKGRRKSRYSYYYNLNNYKQEKSDSYEALVCPH